MRLFSLLLIASAIFISACASTGSIQPVPYVKPSDSSKAILYVFRSLSMPTKANVKIEIDGKLVGLLPDDRFTWIAVEPGKRAVRIGYPSFPDMSKIVELNVEPGKSYVLQYRGSSGGADMPLFGAGGRVIGTVQVGSRAWTSVDVHPSETVDELTTLLPYVAAMP